MTKLNRLSNDFQNIAIGFIINFLILICSANTCLPQDCKSKLVETEGIAPIYNGDVEQAKDLAIFAAQKKAVEAVAPIEIDSETKYTMMQIVGDWYQIKVGGFIKDWELIKEKSGKINNSYKVHIRAWVKCGREAKEETKLLLSLRKMLLISNNAEETVIEDYLRQILSKQGFRYVDSHYLKNNASFTLWNNLTQNRILHLDDEVYKFLADFVVHIEASVHRRIDESDLGGTWYFSSANLSLQQLSGTKRGEPIIEVAVESEKLFARRALGGERQKQFLLTTQHPNGFINQIAQPLTTRFLNRMMDSGIFKTRDRNITLKIANVPSRSEYKKLLSTIKSQRGVQGRVTEASQNGRTYNLSVQFPIKTIYLGNLLALNKHLKLTRQEWNRLEFKYRD